LKFSPASQPVRIGTALQDGMVAIWVADNGRGIPKTEFDNIWKSFYQIERTVYEDQGTGTGLALVSGIVALHGGRKHIASEIGAGSRFTLLLPVHEGM
ncbi:MAG: ATP-binding protein, partial [Armatimonadetes bacterium]|nr:ATP-binding protein [Anaerolineae bacterium]